MNLKNNKGRATLAIVMIWAVVATEVISQGMSLYMYYLGKQLILKGATLIEIFEAMMLFDNIAMAVYIAVFLTSAITFIMWLRRAYCNLSMRRSGLKFADLQAAIAWFIPILNLFRPYQIVKDLFVKTEELLVSKGRGGRLSYTIDLVSIWWGIWIIRIAVNAGGYLFGLHKPESFGQLFASLVVQAIGLVCMIILAPITVRIIRDYSRIEPIDQ